jgi:hypothetical protein
MQLRVASGILFGTLHTIWLHNITLNSRNWALLEKPPIVQLLKSFPATYGTRRFNTVFIRALHWSLSWARSIQSILRHFIPQRCILILSTNLRLGFPSGLFPSGFPTNILYAYLFSSFVLHALPILSSLTQHYIQQLNIIALPVTSKWCSA